VNDRRVVTLLVVVAVLVLGNIGATVYFGISKPASTDSANSGSAASREVSEKEAASLVRNVVSLYNENKIHELYLTFDDLARIQISEQKMAEEMAKVRALAGKVDDYAFLNSEVAGKQGDRPVITLIYKARLSGATFTSGTLRVSVMKKEGQLALLGFFVNAQSTPAQ
jgi:hypothetical protein